MKSDIEIVMGLRGYGKSMYLTRYALKYIKKYNKNVYSNFNIEGAFEVDINDIMSSYFTNCLIIIDEAQLDINSRNYKNFSSKLLELFSMSRHYDVSILVATQHTDSIDIAVRRLADNLIMMDKTIFKKWLCRYKILHKKIYLSSEYDNSYNKKKCKFGTIEEGYYYSHKYKYMVKNKWGKYYNTKDKRFAEKEIKEFKLYPVFERSNKSLEFINVSRETLIKMRKTVINYFKR